MTTDVEMPDVHTSDIVVFPTMHLLQLVKDAQQQHGLRHGDYNRYRMFCRSRLARIRRALKFTNTHKCRKGHKAKFAKKWVGPEVFENEKFIHIGLFEAERSWAKAMCAKLVLEDNSDKLRKRHAMRSYLKRAVIHAKHMEQLVCSSDRCDATTKLEAQAYAAWLHGVCCFELKQWAECSKSLNAAKNIYEGLAEATVNTTVAAIYRNKCRDIKHQLRLCEFNLSETTTEATVSELMAIRMQIGGGESLDKLIAEVRSKAASDNAVTINWEGNDITVEDDKLRNIIRGWVQAREEISRCQDTKEILAFYEKQLSDTRDGIDRVNDLIRRKTSENADTSVLKAIKNYLEYQKTNGTAERYVTLIANTKAEKKFKPQDLLRLYASVIDIYSEALELIGAAAPSALISTLQAKIEYYRAFRAFHVAEAYLSLGKYNEGFSLLERTLERRDKALKLFSAAKEKSLFLFEKEDELDSLPSIVENVRAQARAQRLLDATSASEETKPKKIQTFIENLNVWRDWENERSGRDKEIHISVVPPKFIPMPNKPFFLDVALNHVKMPDLEEKIRKLTENAKPQSVKKSASQKPAQAEDDSSGISGMMKNFFWGKK